MSLWWCEEAGCNFVSQSKAGLVNHMCQEAWMDGGSERAVSSLQSDMWATGNRDAQLLFCGPQLNDTHGLHCHKTKCRGGGGMYVHADAHLCACVDQVFCLQFLLMERHWGFTFLCITYMYLRYRHPQRSHPWISTSLSLYKHLHKNEHPGNEAASDLQFMPFMIV